MAPLLKPRDCTLLRVAPSKDFEIEGSTCEIPIDLARLMRAANLSQVPIFTARLPNQAQHPTSDNSPPSEQTIYDIQTSKTPWAETSLGLALAATGRSSLLLCGYWLDEGITFTALRALGEGYDVYLLTDASPVLDNDARNTALLRLVQSGVVPTTTRQAIREWAANIPDLSQRDHLLALL